MCIITKKSMFSLIFTLLFTSLSITTLLFAGKPKRKKLKIKIEKTNSSRSNNTCFPDDQIIFTGNRHQRSPKGNLRKNKKFLKNIRKEKSRRKHFYFEDQD